MMCLEQVSRMKLATVCATCGTRGLTVHWHCVSTTAQTMAHAIQVPALAGVTPVGLPLTVPSSSVIITVLGTARVLRDSAPVRMDTAAMIAASSRVSMHARGMVRATMARVFATIYGPATTALCLQAICLNAPETAPGAEHA